MRVYVAGPLFNEMERARNRQVKELLQRVGCEVHLPQENAEFQRDPTRPGETRQEARARVFAQDVQALRSSDIVLCLLDGRAPDEGMCVELGMAHALGKPCLALKTDARGHDPTGENNLMITAASPPGSPTAWRSWRRSFASSLVSSGRSFVSNTAGAP